MTKLKEMDKIKCQICGDAIEMSEYRAKKKDHILFILKMSKAKVYCLVCPFQKKWRLKMFAKMEQ
jgi:hypothetical protein